jgi:hypothetical protein
MAQDELGDVDVLLVTPSASARERSSEPSAPLIEVSFKPDERSVQQLGALIGGAAWHHREPASDHDALDVIQVEPLATLGSQPSQTGALAGVGGR